MNSLISNCMMGPLVLPNDSFMITTPHFLSSSTMRTLNIWLITDLWVVFLGNLSFGYWKVQRKRMLAVMHKQPTGCFKGLDLLETQDSNLLLSCCNIVQFLKWFCDLQNDGISHRALWPWNILIHNIYHMQRHSATAE